MHYIIKIEVQIEAYQKEVVHLIKATNEKEAITEALQDEAHNELIQDGETFIDDYLLYKVASCKPISEANFRLANSLLSPY